jgi:tetratricopeptide (TPR) repeat protein
LDLGEAQLSILNYREAELYFNQVQDVASKLKDKRLIALALVNLGIIYRIDKNYEKATDYQSRALKILTTLNDFDGLGIAHNNLGDIYREQKNYPKALSNYNKALVFFESSGNKESIATVYHNVGIVFEKQGKYANALNYLNRSVEIRSQFGFKGTIYSTYRAISEVYEKINNYKLAQNYLKLYADYADSAKTIESSAKIAELNELYRSEQRERLISVQADSIERQKQEKTLTSTKLENVQLKNNMQAYIITGFAILLVLAGVIGFYRWNQTKIKQQQQEAEMNQTLLRTQMNPHFVFNAMSVIQSYIYDNDTQNSSRFLVNFSKLMRLILENSSKEFIPMETEVDILDKYLSIQKLRFEERFDFEIKVDQKLLDESAIIPPMITQPFIENAIEHGRLHLREDGFIHVHIFEKNKMLFITIEDNGVGRKGAELNKKSSDHKSMAMKITRDRIENLNKKYRAEGFMLIEDYNKIEETGTKVLISIPYRVNAQN